MKGKLCLLLLLAVTAMTAQKPLVTIYGERIDLDKTAIGLDNIDNTSDGEKPISTVQSAAFNLKANVESPAFSGIPKAPTASVSNNSTQIATTAFVLSSALDNRNIYQGSSYPPILMGTKGDIYVQTDGTNVVIWYKIQTSPTTNIWVKKN